MNRLWHSILMCTFLFSASHAAEVPPLPLLEIRALKFTNVTVTGTTRDRVFIRHRGGIATLRVNDLTVDNEVQLGLRAPVPTNSAPLAVEGRDKVGAQTNKAAARAMQLLHVEKWGHNESVNAYVPSLNKLTEYAMMPSVYITAIVMFIALYFVYCLLLWRICERAGSETSLFVFLPGLRWIPLFKAAEMPLALIFIGIFGILGAAIPPFMPNIFYLKIAYFSLIVLLQVGWVVVMIVWSFRICTAVGRSPWLGILVMLPLVHFIGVIILNLGERERKPAAGANVNSGLLSVS